MPNARRKGWVVSSYSVPATLHEAAKAAAEHEGITLSAVIRDALAAYVARVS